ncbi:hypothetical protein H2248_001603 [Termitomyces sp. 'cryptogamus']|nr:hypothetical protein H2248_001603 [Termitomyces sp. 'cryptogamus']
MIDAISKKKVLVPSTQPQAKSETSDVHSQDWHKTGYDARTKFVECPEGEIRKCKEVVQTVSSNEIDGCAVLTASLLTFSIASSAQTLVARKTSRLFRSDLKKRM